MTQKCLHRQFVGFLLQLALPNQFDSGDRPALKGVQIEWQSLGKCARSSSESLFVQDGSRDNQIDRKVY